MFIAFICLALVAVGAFIFAKKTAGLEDRKGRPDKTLNQAGKVIGGVALVLALGFGITSTMFFQGEGEAKLLRNFDGKIVGDPTTTAGLHFKAPYWTALTYDIRNNTVGYIGDSKSGDYSGGSASGNQITIQDMDGTSANVDIVVRYSLEPSSVNRIYKQFGTQENFVSKVITNGVRSVVRDAPASRTALEFLNERAKVGNEIQVALEKRWADDGVIVDEVDLQEIRYSETVRASFDAAQETRIATEKARAEKATATQNAEKAIIEAQGRASAAIEDARGVSEANRLQAASLTPALLQQQYYEAIGKSGTIVVPEGSTPWITIPETPAK